ALHAAGEGRLDVAAHRRLPGCVGTGMRQRDEVDRQFGGARLPFDEAAADRVHRGTIGRRGDGREEPDDFDVRALAERVERPRAVLAAAPRQQRTLPHLRPSTPAPPLRRPAMKTKSPKEAIVPHFGLAVASGSAAPTRTGRRRKEFRTGSKRRYVLRLGTFLSLRHPHRYFLTFTQGPAAGGIDRAVMHEHVLAALAGDEAKALLFVEPLYGPLDYV